MVGVYCPVIFSGYLVLRRRIVVLFSLFSHNVLLDLYCALKFPHLLINDAILTPSVTGSGLMRKATVQQNESGGFHSYVFTAAVWFSYSNITSLKYMH